MTILTDNGTTAARDKAYRILESDARHLLAEGAPVDRVAASTGLSVATVEVLAEEVALDAPVAAEPVVVHVEPKDVIAGPAAAHALPDVAALLARADRHTDRRVLTVAARIRHDVDLLASLLANTAEVKAARKRLDTLQQRRELLEAQIERARLELAEVQDTAPAAPSNGTVTQYVRAPLDPLAFDADVRAWLRREGYPVAAQGRIKDVHLAVYREAHPEADAS